MALAKSEADCTHFPLVTRLLGDELTPVSAFARLEATSDHAFLLESVVGGEKVARYSFLGVQPRRVMVARGSTMVVSEWDGRRLVARKPHTIVDPLAELDDLMWGRKAYQPPGLPRFTGGLVGYAAYDCVRYAEARSLPTPPADDRHLPDLIFGLYDQMVIFDHVDKTLRAIVMAELPKEGRTKAVISAAYADASARLGDLVGRLHRPLAGGFAPTIPGDGLSGRLPAFTSNLTPARFQRQVSAAKEYIAAGDIFQVVLSHRVRVRTQADPLLIYRALRVVNPSPFMFYIKSPEVTLVGASPEILCRVENQMVTNRPLAGTRRRGRSAAEDAALEAELLGDPKDRAEHIMLVDLGRNDVGRVCEPGSVRLTECMQVEKYSHVMHISSEVQGRLMDSMSAFDALRQALPVGTVSGAPKVRAMQIIDELEPTRRGPYGGAVGYVDFSGNMDTCIALRTMVIRPEPVEKASKATASSHAGRQGKPSKPAKGVSTPQTFVVDLQAGAGIVADSVEKLEYEETINKSKAMLRAVQMAESILRPG